MPNRLAYESSPYLIQHAENPVEWYPWGTEALDNARSEDRPIFLSIGYAACHWCHVMAHESFEDPATAALMNNNFINIKVDREERPDLDYIYMQAVIAFSGNGGWPMSVFLTPDGKPFYGGTYFPPVRRYQMPAFQEVLQTIARLWKEDRLRLLESSIQITDYLKKQSVQMAVVEEGEVGITKELLDQASIHLAQSYDWDNGGWGKAPKFPQPMAIEYLIRRAVRGDRMAKDVATHALQSMAAGGMYDVVGGGFARYSTDDRWLIPHFEKMLYDNALLAQAYLHAWLITGQDNFRRVCVETLDFVVREMTNSGGGFISSLDADSEGEEGLYYIWTPEEIRSAIGDNGLAEVYIAAYGVTETGNFDGKNVLQRALTDEQISKMFDIQVGTISELLSELNARLLAARSERIRPAADDKVLVAWNALMNIAYSEAGRYLGRADYIEVAQRNAHFLLENLLHEGRLLRSWRNGQAKHTAYLDDHAALALALMSLYQTDSNPEWFDATRMLVSYFVESFHDPSGGFFDTQISHEDLIIRPKDLQDNATPSGNALAALALLHFDAFEGQNQFIRQAEQTIANVQRHMFRYPTAFAQWLCAADFYLGPVIQLAVLNPVDGMSEFQRVLWGRYQPRLVSAYSLYPPGSGSPMLLNDRPLLNNLPTAYLCQGFICQQPTNSPSDLMNQLGQII